VGGGMGGAVSGGPAIWVQGAWLCCHMLWWGHPACYLLVCSNTQAMPGNHQHHSMPTCMQQLAHASQAVTSSQLGYSHALLAVRHGLVPRLQQEHEAQLARAERLQGLPAAEEQVAQLSM
jgi:hypothetical protein